MSLSRKVRIHWGKLKGSLLHRKHEPEALRAEAAEVLRQTATSIPVMSTESLEPAAAEWARHTNELRRLCVSADPARFIRWKVVRGTMFVDASKFVDAEHHHLSRHEDYEARWMPAIRESWVGGPPRFWMDGRTSGNRYRLAYDLARFEEETGNRLSDYDSIVEFGGGYGCLCDLVHRLGFRGRYVMRDLPCQSALQQYYLTRNGLKIVAPHEPGNGISLVTSEGEFEEAMTQVGGKRLFISLWALSETPLEVRALTEELTRPFESCLLGYQDHFESVDNIPYFDDWCGRRPHLSFHRESISHMEGCNYAFGY